MATMRRPHARILLLGGDADHNVGDRAILAALVNCLNAREPSTEISIVGEASEYPSMPSVAEIIPRGPRGLYRLLGAAARADQVLVAGGGLFQDDDSRAKMPYWAARIALIKAVNSHVAGFSVGAGPLRHAESRASARMACAALTQVSVRDRFAREALAPCTARPIDIVPDPAFMLEAAPQEDAREHLRQLGFRAGKPLIAATIRRWYHARGGFVPNRVRFGLGLEPRRDHARFEGMLGAVARSFETLRQRLDADILLLPGYTVEHEADDAACEALRWRLPGANVRVARIMNPRLYKALLGHASLVVSARMHPLILAAGMGVPFVGLSYNPKFDGLYEILGLSARSLPLDQCPDTWGVTTLVAAAEAALDSRVDLRQRAETLAATVRSRAVEAAFGAQAAKTLETADA
jgi:polysaccharide pyruvyl transferase WcaK-like protein